MAQLITSANADGFNGDTMAGISQVFQSEAAAQGYNIMLQPEVGMPGVRVTLLGRGVDVIDLIYSSNYSHASS